MSLTYREIRREELPLLWAIDRSETVRHHHAVVDGELVVRPDSFRIRGWPPGMQEAETPRLIEAFDRGCWFYGAFDGDRLAGWTVLESRFLNEGGDRLQLKYLYVDRAYRNRGVGVTLFEAARSVAREKGAKRLYVSATPSENTVKFYRGRGCVLSPAPDPGLLALEPEDIHLECEV